MSHLTNNLRYLRKKHSLSQEDMAKLLFVTHQTISNHETGKSEPDLETIQKYAKFYNVNFQDLIHVDLSKKHHKTKVIFDEVIFIKNGEIVLHENSEELRSQRHASINDIFKEEFKC